MDILTYTSEFLWQSWLVTTQMAPYLLLGFLIAGVLSVFVSPEWVERHLGGKGFMPVLKSVLLGVPLPLCSCGVIPVTASIRRHGASPGATAGFLLATPQTGADSILATWGMLGPVVGVLRPLMALVTGIAGGVLVTVLDPGGDTEDGAAAPACHAECCSGGGSSNAVVRALRYGFVTLPRDIGKALIIGVAVAAIITTLVPRGALAQYFGSGWLGMAAMMVVGIPIYVCSTASIPIALGFIHMGVSPGAALVFLITGPATNAATLTTVWKVLGRRTALIYLATVACGALGAGFLLDFAAARFGFTVMAAQEHVHAAGPSGLGHAFALLLVLVLLWSILPHGRGRGPATPGEPGDLVDAAAGTRLQDVTLNIEGMTCSHCAGAVERALRETAGVHEVDVELSTGRAVVAGEALDPGGLCRAVDALGYSATPVK